MIVGLALRSKGNELFQSDIVTSVTEEQREALEKKAESLREDEESNFDLIVVPKVFSNDRVNNKIRQLEVEPKEVGAYIDQWIERCIHYNDCRYERCELG